MMVKRFRTVCIFCLMAVLSGTIAFAAPPSAGDESMTKEKPPAMVSEMLMTKEKVAAMPSGDMMKMCNDQQMVMMNKACMDKMLVMMTDEQRGALIDSLLTEPMFKEQMTALSTKEQWKAMPKDQVITTLDKMMMNMNKGQMRNLTDKMMLTMNKEQMTTMMMNNTAAMQPAISTAPIL